MIIFMLANAFQHRISEAAITEFKDLSLEVKDFAIEVTGLPSIKKYKNQHILKAMLWQSFIKTLEATPQQIPSMEKT